MKLYDKYEEPVIKVAIENITPNESKEIDKDIITLEAHIKAYTSLVIVENQIASEDFNFVDKGNYVLYNEYINTVTRNLGVKNIPIVTQEALSTLSGTALNHHVALEGFIADMWKKIKEIFSKIYNSIKEFFNKYFTRLGRIKNKLKNISEVLNEVDKNLGKPSLDIIPGGLSKKYPVSGDIDIGIINEVMANIKVLVDSLNDINGKASDFINKDILDKDFISKINTLKQEIESSYSQIDANNKDAKDTGENVDNANSSLDSVAKRKTDEMNKEKAVVRNIGNKENNLDSEDIKAAEAKKEFEDFINTLVTSLQKVKGKNLINGKNITNVSGSANESLNIEISDSKDTPSSIKLGTKNELIKTVKQAIIIVDNLEKLAKEYGKINDTVMKKLNDVDKLINDLDKLKDEKLGSYRKLLNNKVKVRLNIVKTFFNNYNKVSKNILGMGLDCGDGVIEYTTLSLKYFGTVTE